MGRDASTQTYFYKHTILNLIPSLCNKTISLIDFFDFLADKDFSECFNILSQQQKFERPWLIKFVLYFLDKIEDIAALLESNETFRSLCLSADVNDAIQKQIFNNEKNLLSVFKKTPPDLVPPLVQQTKVPNIYLIIGCYYFLQAYSPDINNNSSTTDLLLKSEKYGFFVAAAVLNQNYLDRDCEYTCSTEEILKRIQTTCELHGAPAHIEAASLLWNIGMNDADKQTEEGHDTATIYYHAALKHLYAAKFLEDSCENENFNAYGTTKIPPERFIDESELKRYVPQDMMSVCITEAQQMRKAFQDSLVNATQTNIPSMNSL